MKLYSSSGPSYVNVSAEIRLNDEPDHIVERCIFRGSNDGDTRYESYVAPNTSDLWWDEKFKLCIPEDIAPRALLIFKFHLMNAASHSDEASEPEPPVAIAALNLSINGRFIRDGEHRMKIRRLDSGYTLEQQLGPYLVEDTAPPAVFDPVLSVESFLCSTKFTEDGTLHSLLNWKQNIGTLTTDESRFKMKEILRKFTFVSEIEILKVTQFVAFLKIVPSGSV